MILQGVSSLPKRLADYARPRPTTTGDLPQPTPGWGAFAGGLQGLMVGRTIQGTLQLGSLHTHFSGGPLLAGAGVLGAYAGIKVGVQMGKRPGALLAALGTAAAVGGTLSATGLLGVSLLANAPISPGTLALGGLLGAFSGAIGTLSGSRLACTRDGSYGGMLTGGLVGVATQSPLLSIAGAVGGGVGAKAPTTIGRVIMGGFSGAAAGAASSILGGGPAMLHNAVLGAGIGAAGAVVGPVFRQIMRNGTEDAATKIFAKLDPWVKKRGGLSTPELMGMGAATGALMAGPLGITIAGGWQGLPWGIGLGAVGGAAFVWKLRHDKQQAEKAAAAPPPQQRQGLPASWEAALGHSQQPQPRELPRATTTTPL